MSFSTNLALPFIEAAQAQKHVTHNEALRLLDTLVQLSVLDRDLGAPPGSPSEGQRWIVAANPTGAWGGHVGHVAAWQDAAWQFSAPKMGWTAFVVDESALVTWNGTAWVSALAALASYQNITLLGVGTAADAANPFSAKLNNALWVAKTTGEGGTGDLRYKLSKQAAGNTLSLLFQTNFSGRAEIGLTGDDDFHVKVSADGATWAEALTLKAATGQALYAPGSALAPSLSFAGRTGDGSWSPAAGILAWSLAGAEAARLSATGLGIGMTAGRKLDVNGTFRASGDAAFTSATSATSTTTGALTVAGGLGVAGALFAGAPSQIAAAGLAFDVSALLTTKSGNNHQLAYYAGSKVFILTAGFNVNSGFPFLAFQAEHSTTSGTTMRNAAGGRGMYMLWDHNALSMVVNGSTAASADFAGPITAVSVNYAGAMTIAGALTQNSDARIKRLTGQVLDDPIGRLIKLGGSKLFTFTDRDDKGEHLGFVIDDRTQDAFPWLVRRDARTGVRSFDYAGLAAPMADIVIDHENRLRTLEMRVAN